MTSNDDKLIQLFNELVPSKGAAETVAGEIIRAMMVIKFETYQRLLKIGRCPRLNSAARYLQKNTNDIVAHYIDLMWNSNIDYIGYLTAVEVLLVYVLNIIEKNPNLKSQRNHDNYENYKGE